LSTKRYEKFIPRIIVKEIRSHSWEQLIQKNPTTALSGFKIWNAQVYGSCYLCDQKLHCALICQQSGISKTLFNQKVPY